MNFTGLLPSRFSDKPLTPADLFRFFVHGMLPAEFAVLAKFETVGMSLLVFVRAVVAILALGTRQSNVNPHKLSSFF